jgi:hypothetical protein
VASSRFATARSSGWKKVSSSLPIADSPPSPKASRQRFRATSRCPSQPGQKLGLVRMCTSDRVATSKNCAHARSYLAMPAVSCGGSLAIRIEQTRRKKCNSRSFAVRRSGKYPRLRYRCALPATSRGKSGERDTVLETCRLGKFNDLRRLTWRLRKNTAFFAAARNSAAKQGEK